MGICKEAVGHSLPTSDLEQDQFLIDMPEILIVFITKLDIEYLQLVIEKDPEICGYSNN